MSYNTKIIEPKVGILFLGRKRPGFVPEWGAKMEDKVRTCLDRMDFEIFEPAKKVIDDDSLRKADVMCKNAGVNVIVVLQATMADGRLAPTLAQLWHDPILLWATPEDQKTDMISACSLVGTHNWASILRRMHHPFEVIYGDPDQKETLTQFNDAVQIAFTVGRLHGSRLAVVGGQAPGYFAMSVDPFTMHQGLGTQPQHFSLLEFSDLVHSLTDKEVAEDVRKVKAMGIPFKDADNDDLPMASRLYLAMRSFYERENFDMLCVRCWPEMSNHFGQWPYVGIARLSEEGFAISCEGDADGAVCAFICENLNLGRCYLSDWLEHDQETITTWHTGIAPFSWAPEPGQPGGPQIAKHFNNKKPLVIESTIKPDMPITIFRIWHCDAKYLMTAKHGITIEPKRHLMGTNGLARLTDCNPQEWFLDLCHAGMPHHISICQDHHAALLRQFAKTMNIQWID